MCGMCYEFLSQRIEEITAITKEVIMSHKNNLMVQRWRKKQMRRRIRRKVLVSWDPDTEKYVRHPWRDRVAYFVVERRPTGKKKWTIVSPVNGVPNLANSNSGRVEFFDTPTAGSFDYRIKAVDQYGMESLYTDILVVPDCNCGRNSKK